MPNFTAMEFDTSIKLKQLSSADISSPYGKEEFTEKVWNILSKYSSEIGEGGSGQFWLDYSTTMSTRHMVVDVDEKEPNLYHVTIRSGSRASRITDVCIVVLVLLAFWFLSKMFVPAAPWYYIAGLCASLLIAGALALFSGKSFGVSDAANLMYEIQNLK